ncbi:MAG: hypothetical protein K2K53_11845, partial [Oscillospiraceae bacterium]|nr:hypothetical protein [Oscillospiraceae bacterium]
MGFLDDKGLAQVNEIINKRLAAKQDKLTGAAGQVVGFDGAGNAVAQEAVGGGSGSSLGEARCLIFDTSGTFHVPENAAGNLFAVICQGGGGDGGDT